MADISTLSVYVKKLITDEDIEIAENKLQSGIQMLKSFKGSLKESFEYRHNIMKPGMALDKTKMLNITAKLSGESWATETEIKMGVSTFASSVVHAISDVFGKDNILSCVVKQKDMPVCYVTVYPVNGRKLEPDKWIHKINKDRLTDDTMRIIERYVHKQFPNLITNENSGQSNDLASLGYSEDLINFKPTPYTQEDDTELTWYTEDVDSQVQSHMPIDQLKKLAEETLVYFTVGPESLLFNQSQKPDSDITPEKYLHEVEDWLIRKYSYVVASDRKIILNRIYRAVFENYVLEPLINDEAISDIKVISPDKIRVKVGGQRYTSNLRFINGDDYNRFIYSLAVRNSRDLTSEAIHVFSDTTTNDKFRMRFNITTPYINSSEYPYLHIRKIAKHKRGMDYLLKAGMLDQKIAEYLIDKARYGKGLIFCGKGASGKTTLMNCLIDYIPYNKSGLVIQESEELFSDAHPDIMFQHVKLDGPLLYDLRAEAKNGLLTDLDYFIIGEVKDAEAKYFITAADTGHRCWCSVHSPSSTDAIDKLADYITYDSPYSKTEAEYMLKDLGTVIFLKNFKVCEISELNGWDKENKQIIYKKIYKRPGV